MSDQTELIIGGAEEAQSKDISTTPNVNTTQEPANDITKSKSNEPEKGQTGYVRELAWTLFDSTLSLHELGEQGRNLLGIAAMLHRTRLARGRKKLTKELRRYVSSQFQQELSHDAVDVITSVAALQHGMIKRKDVAKLDLSPVQQREALTLAAILKIAQGLDESESQETAIEQVVSERDKVYIVVSGPDTLIDVVSAQRNARFWTKIGYPEIQVLDLSEAQRVLLPFPEPMEATGIDSADEIAEAGRKVMRYHFAEMLRHEDGTRHGEDIEALHDMRVATRRMRAAFEVFSEAFEPEALKPHLKGLRAAGRALGQVRDLDVFMEKAQSYLNSFPEDQRIGLDALLNEWHTNREKAREEMLVYMDSQQYYDFKRNFNLFVNTPGMGARPAPADWPTPPLVKEIAPVLIYTRLAAVRAYEAIVENATIQQLHALRIEFKKLRYTVEYFREVLGEEVKPVINELKGLQDHLGDLNDAQVACLIVQEFLERRQGQKQTSLEVERLDDETIRAYLNFRYNERERLFSSFPEVWEKFVNAEFRRNLALAVSVL